MNRDEIGKIPAGRETDMLIAVEVMGWRVDAETAYSPSGSANARQTHMGEPWLPYYSTDMSDAWMVVEKIKDWGEGWCPQIYWDDNDGLEPGEWVAEFNKYWKAENDYRHFEAVADTAPLAICRAALLTNKKAE